MGQLRKRSIRENSRRLKYNCGSIWDFENNFAIFVRNSPKSEQFLTSAAFLNKLNHVFWSQKHIFDDFCVLVWTPRCLSKLFYLKYFINTYRAKNWILMKNHYDLIIIWYHAESSESDMDYITHLSSSEWHDSTDNALEHIRNSNWRPSGKQIRYNDVIFRIHRTYLYQIIKIPQL